MLPENPDQLALSRSVTQDGFITVDRVLYPVNEAAVNEGSVECEDNNGNCQQLCIDQIDGHEFACYDNYDPSTDAKYDLLFVVDVSDSVTDNIWRYYQGSAEPFYKD